MKLESLGFQTLYANRKFTLASVWKAGVLCFMCCANFLSFVAILSKAVLMTQKAGVSVMYVCRGHRLLLRC